MKYAFTISFFLFFFGHIAIAQNNEKESYEREISILSALSELGKTESIESGSETSHSESVMSWLSPLSFISSNFHKANDLGNNYLRYLPSVSGIVTSGYGFRPKFGRMHYGVDIAMNIGDTVRVPLSGFVKRISYEPRGYGRYVVVIHENGLETRYAHLSLSLVMPGQRVTAGQPIALSGNSGNSTGPHLHFESRLDGIPVNPFGMFSFIKGYILPTNVPIFHSSHPMDKISLSSLNFIIEQSE